MPTALYRVFGEVLVGEDPTPEVLLAQARLAFAAQNMHVARDAAHRALLADTAITEARTIELRAQSVLGEHELPLPVRGNSIPPASLAKTSICSRTCSMGPVVKTTRPANCCALSAKPETKLGADRRLIAISLRNGDLDGAEKRLAPLMGDSGSAVVAVLYFAQLAERRGDDARAVQSYRLLADSSLGLAARSSAARLMIKHGDIKGALALLDEYAAKNPDSVLEAGAARATLLADSGDLKSALEGLDELDKAYPGYPDLEYTRATVLEMGGRTRDSVAQFDRAIKDRPDDPQLLNALGFTLADHKQDLPARREADPRGAGGFAGQPRGTGQPRLGAVPARQEIRSPAHPRARLADQR